jgi:hypothetical protein
MRSSRDTESSINTEDSKSIKFNNTDDSIELKNFLDFESDVFELYDSEEEKEKEKEKEKKNKTKNKKDDSL